MKIKLNDLVVKTITNQLIYKLVVENGTTYLEEMKVTQVPNDQNEYFIPAEISNHNGEVRMGLIYCVPAIRTIEPPILVPENDGHLVEILGTGFIDLNKYYDVNPLISLEYHEGETTVDAPKDIAWSHFLPFEIPPNVAYLFIPTTHRVGTIGTEVGKYEIGLQLSNFNSEGNDDDEPLFDVCEFVLRKIQINDIPSTGLIWYLPVNISFNSSQKRNGYLLYNSVLNETQDVHIFDSKYGLVSALNDNDSLEDCGIFKDDNVFSYRLLLSEVYPTATNESNSANTENDA
jgi:hypothetical protein